MSATVTSYKLFYIFCFESLCTYSTMAIGDGRLASKVREAIQPRRTSRCDRQGSGSGNLGCLNDLASVDSRRHGPAVVVDGTQGCRRRGNSAITSSDKDGISTGLSKTVDATNGVAAQGMVAERAVVEAAIARTTAGR